MPSEYSIYSIQQAQGPKWLPGEDLGAAAFLAMTFLLVVDINFQIHYAFKRATGIYFWAMQIGSIGCFVDAIGTLMHYLLPNFSRYWALYTLLATVGWAVYTVAQLTVLYSRLHLVVQNEGVQRMVFWMIVLVSPPLILSDWIVIWPSYNPATDVGGRWSVAAGIVERICQLGLSGVEVIINLPYVVGLLAILRRRPTVRQRRVMLDLTYVNVLTILLDILNIVLVYVNRVGISHPIQTFSYTLKLRLEFITLNQLMAVAARDVYRQTFENRRYHYQQPSTFEGWGFGQVQEIKDETTAQGNAETRRASMIPGSSPNMYIPDPIFLTPQVSNTSITSHRSQRGRTGKVARKLSPWRRTFSSKQESTARPNKLRKAPPNDWRIMGGLGDNPPTTDQRRLRDDELEGDAIGLEMWDRRGNNVLEAPWFSGSCLA